MTPSHNEIRVASQRFKNNKTAGSDGLPAELFNARGEKLVECMHQLVYVLRKACPLIDISDIPIAPNPHHIFADKMIRLCRVTLRSPVAPARQEEYLFKLCAVLDKATSTL